MLSETKRGLTKKQQRFAPFSPLLVGVLSETCLPALACAMASCLSVPYWSGCSVKPVPMTASVFDSNAFSPLLVGVLSETLIKGESYAGMAKLSVPYWSGCSVKRIGLA